MPANFESWVDNSAGTYPVSAARLASSMRAFNVMSPAYGAVNDGSTNDRAAIQAACDAAASNGGGIVWFPPGAGYKINSQVTVTASNVYLRGAGIGQSVIIQGSSTGNVAITGAEGSSIALTANATQGDTTLTMGSTTGLAANDYINLYSTANWPNTTNSSKQGEIVRIKSVDSGTVITLWQRIEDSYTTANSAAIRKLTLLDGCGASGLTIRNPTPGTLTIPGFSVKWVQNAIFSDCKFERLDGSGVSLQASVDSLVDNCHFRDLTDDVANARFGYGVNLNGPTKNCVVSNCVMRGGRHAVTHGGSDRGIPRHNRTHACRATHQSAAGFDTHIESSHNTFSDCEVWGQFGTTEGYGYALAGPYSTLLDCRGGFLRQSIISVDDFADRATIIGGRFGPQITGDNALFNQGASTSVIGALFEDCPSTCINNDTGGAIYVDPSTRFVNCTTPVGGTLATAITYNTVNNRFAITYSASMTPDMRAKHQVIVVTNGTAFTINNPTSSVTGMELVLEIRNTSGGAMGAITWGGNFKMAGAFTNPANGQRRTISFVYTGAHWLELHRAAADIPN